MNLSMRYRLWKARRRQRAFCCRLLRRLTVEVERDAALRNTEYVLVADGVHIVAVASIADDETIEDLYRKWGQ